MRTQSGYRALDGAVQQEQAFPDAGMHSSYDVRGNARYCSCSEFWASNPDPSEYVAHEDTGSTAYINLTQIAYMKELQAP